MSPENLAVPAELMHRRWILDYDPSRTSPFWIRFAAVDGTAPDMRPIRSTTDIVGTGESLQGAWEMAMSEIPEVRTAVFRAMAKRWPDDAERGPNR